MPKARPRFVNGRTYMPGAYQDWKNEARYALGKAWKGREPIKASLRIRILAVSRKAPRGDMDNLAGGILDSGNGLVWIDDRVFRGLEIDWERAGSDSEEGILLEVEAWLQREGRGREFRNHPEPMVLGGIEQAREAEPS